MRQGGWWGAALLATAAGCAEGPGGIGRLGGEPDACGQQLASYQSVGTYFTPAPSPAPGRWADAQPAVASGGLADDLLRENAELDRLQIAFDALLYCRWIELRSIRADFNSSRLPRPQAEARIAAAGTRLRRELAQAQELGGRLERRGTAFETAAERAAPGTRQTLAARRATRGAALRAVAQATVTLRLRPEASAPEVGRVAAGRGVTLRPAANGFAFVEGADGQGYAQAGAFAVAGQGSALAAPEPGAGARDLRTLAASNLAKRENFAESVALAERSLTAGFELAL